MNEMQEMINEWIEYYRQNTHKLSDKKSVESEIVEMITGDGRWFVLDDKKVIRFLFAVYLAIEHVESEFNHS